MLQAHQRLLADKVVINRMKEVPICLNKLVEDVKRNILLTEGWCLSCHIANNILG